MAAAFPPPPPNRTTDAAAGGGAMPARRARCELLCLGCCKTSCCLRTSGWDRQTVRARHLRSQQVRVACCCLSLFQID